MSARILALGLLLSVSVVAVEPGKMAPGNISEIAQDGNGNIWALELRETWGLSMLVGSSWVSQQVPELEKGYVPKVLQRFADGDVGCLWQDDHGTQSQWLLTRHRAGRSRRVTRLPRPLKDPTMAGDRSGRVFITESGRTCVVTYGNADRADIITLPEEIFMPPARNKSDGTPYTHYAPVRITFDHSDVPWMWSMSTPRDVSWRLTGILKVEKGPTQLVSLAANDPPICQLFPWDVDHLAFVVESSGLYLFNPSTSEIEPIEVPDPNAFQYIEQVFHDGEAWHAVTTPRPSETEASTETAIAGHILVKTKTFYDQTKPACSLWRKEIDGWKKLKDGLDEKPVFVPRPWLRTAAGLFVGSSSGAPWFFPSPRGEPRRILEAGSFPLSRVDRIFKVSESEVLLTCRSPAAACLWPADPPIASKREQRWEKFETMGNALQDAQGHIWCFRGPRAFMHWDGHEWKSVSPPPLEATKSSIGFAADDRGRGWLLRMSDDLMAVFDFATHKWQIFASPREALVAQLPQGMKLNFPQHPLYEYAFSKDGRIGAFTPFGKVLLYEGKKWREWGFTEIAGKETDLSGAPFFAPNGRFSVPTYARDIWQWFGEAKGWQRSEGGAVPYSFAAPHRISLKMPDGNPLSDGFGALDRNEVLWFLRKNGTELCKGVLGREVKVFNASESKPYPPSGLIYRACTDNNGNVLLDGAIYGDHPQVFIRSRLPAPTSSAQLVSNAQDTVHILAGSEDDKAPFHTWRMDGGPWHPLQEAREIEITGLLPGRHTVEVRAFNAELTPAPEIATLSITTVPATNEQFAERVAELRSPSLETREKAARMLKNQGSGALPKLRAAREAATPDAQWWLDAIIQDIERSARMSK